MMNKLQTTIAQGRRRQQKDDFMKMKKMFKDRVGINREKDCIEIDQKPCFRLLDLSNIQLDWPIDNCLHGGFKHLQAPTLDNILNFGTITTFVTPEDQFFMKVGTLVSKDHTNCGKFYADLMKI